MDREPEMASMLPPYWELINWEKRGGQVIIKAKHDGMLDKVIIIYTLPMVAESRPLHWLKEVIDLKLLWAIS